MDRVSPLIECQVVSYRRWFTGRRAIVGLQGEINIGFHWLLHPKSEVLEHCYHDRLKSRVEYWREILKVGK